MEVKCYPSTSKERTYRLALESRGAPDQTVSAPSSSKRTQQTAKQPPELFVHIKIFKHLPKCSGISETCRQTHVVGAQRGSVNDARMEHVRVTALRGADWQAKPTPRRDGSLYAISQATALSQDREPSIFSTREKKDRPKEREDQSYGKAWEPIKRRKPSPPGSSIFPFQL